MYILALHTYQHKHKTKNTTAQKINTNGFKGFTERIAGTGGFFKN